MATSVRRRGAQTCINCDRPAPKLAPLVRGTRSGKRLTFRVYGFCDLQLVPGTKIGRLPV